MLKKQMEQYIADHIHDDEIALFAIEKEYVQQHQLLPDGVTATEKVFHTHVLERCNKETEDLIGTETPAFLAQPISYLKEHSEEFIFVESTIFELIRIDAIALEFDGVFKTFSALFGLKLQKKFGDAIKAYLDTQLHQDSPKYSVMFSNEEGLWDVNFALDYVDGFNEGQSFEEIYNMIYRFVFKLVEAIEEAQ